MEISVMLHAQTTVKITYAIRRMDVVNHATLDGTVLSVKQVCFFSNAYAFDLYTFLISKKGE